MHCLGPSSGGGRKKERSASGKIFPKLMNYSCETWVSENCCWLHKIGFLFSVSTLFFSLSLSISKSFPLLLLQVRIQIQVYGKKTIKRGQHIDCTSFSASLLWIIHLPRPSELVLNNTTTSMNTRKLRQKKALIDLRAQLHRLLIAQQRWHSHAHKICLNRC